MRIVNLFRSQAIIRIILGKKKSYRKEKTKNESGRPFGIKDRSEKGFMTWQQ